MIQSIVCWISLLFVLAESDTLLCDIYSMDIDIHASPDATFESSSGSWYPNFPVGNSNELHVQSGSLLFATDSQTFSSDGPLNQFNGKFKFGAKTANVLTDSPSNTITLLDTEYNGTAVSGSCVSIPKKAPIPYMEFTFEDLTHDSWTSDSGVLVASNKEDSNKVCLRNCRLPTQWKLCTTTVNTIVFSDVESNLPLGAICDGRNCTPYVNRFFKSTEAPVYYIYDPSVGPQIHVTIVGGVVIVCSFSDNCPCVTATPYVISMTGGLNGFQVSFNNHTFELNFNETAQPIIYPELTCVWEKASVGPYQFQEPSVFDAELADCIGCNSLTDCIQDAKEELPTP